MIYYDKNHVMFRTAVASDVARMKDDLRLDDIREIAASHGHSPEQALLFSLEVSHLCITIVYKGKPVAMFGCAPDPSSPHAGTVWLLGTTGLREMWLTFLKVSHEFIGLMLDLYPVLYNYVDARNKKSIDWLIWCGATFHNPEPYGEKKVPFRFFVIEKEKSHV